MGARSRWRKARSQAAAAAVSLAVAMTGCGTDTREPPGVSPPGPASVSPSPAGSRPAGALTVLAPVDGDVVSVPFEVTVDTGGVDVGRIEDGLHHLHIWFEDSQSAPSVITTGSVTVDGDEIPAPDGATTMFVQLHTAEHEPAGEVTSISLTVNSGGGSDGTD